MPYFFFNITDGHRINDEEGQECESLEAAKAEAVLSARTLLREAIMAGRLPLSERIEIADERGEVLATVEFRDTVEID